MGSCVSPLTLPERRPWLPTLFARPDDIGLDACFLFSGGVQLPLEQRLDGAGTRGLGAAGSAHASTLDGERLVHDGAAPGNELEVGDGPSTWRVVGGSRQGAQCRWRRLLQEGAHRPGLMKQRFHGCPQVFEHTTGDKRVVADVLRGGLGRLESWFLFLECHGLKMREVRKYTKPFCSCRQASSQISPQTSVEGNRGPARLRLRSTSLHPLSCGQKLQNCGVWVANVNCLASNSPVAQITGPEALWPGFFVFYYSLQYMTVLHLASTQNTVLFISYNRPSVPTPSGCVVHASCTAHRLAKRRR